LLRSDLTVAESETQVARVWIGDARPRRGRVTAFISDHLAAWETAMAALSIAYLALAVRADNAPRSVPDAALLAFSGLFLAEFAVRCFDAPSRWRYFRAHWLDLLSCIPLVGGLRAIRLVRLVRLAAGIRVLAVMEDTADQRAGGRESLWFLVPSVASIWIGSSYAVWEVEHGINPHLQSFADALYWSFTTATTVGYGDIRPVTPTGRLIAGLLVFVSIGLIGLTSSRLTAMWMHQAREADPTAHELEAIREELAALRALLLEERTRAPSSDTLGTG
jgi:voltage-gated potassium channel